jgi:hypothetical protein
VLYERLKARLSALDVCTDIAARIRVYRRGPDGKAQPAELLPRVYGGRYNQQLRGYTDEPPDNVAEIGCHPGALEFMTADGPLRTLALGSPGGGKSFAAERKAVLLGLDLPNGTIGIVAPTADRKKILWDDLIELLQPLGWIESIRASDDEIRLVNRTRFQFVAAQQPSRRLGTPLQGYSWDAAVEDEHQNLTTKAAQEVNFRGRRAGDSYRVFSTATNQFIPEFQERLSQWYEAPAIAGKARVIDFKGEDNVFVDSQHWENQRAFLSPEDYDRLINGVRSKPQGLICPRYSDRESVRPVPDVGRDITAHLLFKDFGLPAMSPDGMQERYEYVIGHDWGARFQASIVLKAYEDPVTRRRLWWAIDELVTDGDGPDRHAAQLLAKYGRRGVVLADPNTQRRADGASKTDYDVFRAAGLTVHRCGPRGIPLRHRFAMMNALMENADGERRLFLAADSSGKPKTRSLAKSLRTY